MQGLDTIVVILAVLLAVGVVLRKFWKTHKAKEPCCGKGCGCSVPKVRSKIGAKKA